MVQKEGIIFPVCKSANEILRTKWEEYITVLSSNLSLLQVLNPDAIHDVRVTSRRIRALFSELKNFYNFPEELISSTKTITRLLGKRRELDVIKELAIDIFPEYFNITHSFSAYLDNKRELELPKCKEALEFVNKIINSTDFILDLPQYGESCYIEYLSERIEKSFSRLKKIKKKVKKLSQIEEFVSEELHLVRISLKKIRYSLEIFATLIEPLTSIISKIKEVQEVLGIWNDNRVLLLHFNEFLNFDPLLSERNTQEHEEIRQILNKNIKEKVDEVRLVIQKNFKKKYLQEIQSKALSNPKTIECCRKGRK